MILRTLLLFRGAPGCGKSTFIKDNGLTSYTIAPDDLRVLFQSPVLTDSGKEAISQENDKIVWKTLFDILEARMQRGEFTVIDATNSKTAEMNRYRSLAETYRYRVYIIDMTDVPIDVCKERNRSRSPFKQVPDSVIDKMYSRFATQKIPGRIKTLKPNELDKIFYRPINLDQWKKIHIIGDIHGCYTCLQEYLGGLLKEDEYYIFVGDYIGRGIENAEVVKFLIDIAENKNVLLLEGNHERWLKCFAHEVPSKSPEFEKRTRTQLHQAQIDKKQLRVLCRRFIQCAWFEYDNKKYFVSHGGISALKKNPLFIASEQMIRGVGKYESAALVAEAWASNTGGGDFQIFGHRNVTDLPIDMGYRCFNLEGKIEFGQYLRCVELSHGEGARCIETKNNVYNKELTKEGCNSDTKTDTEEVAAQVSVAEVVTAMRKSKFVNEKALGNGISSFNFTRDAFYKKKWNDTTCKARGLFIDTDEDKIIARSYDKFFNVNEQMETRLETMHMSLQFPLTAYVKENGYLGLLSHNPKDDSLFFASKSSCNGPFAELFKNIFYSQVSESVRKEIKNFVKDNNCTLVFEVIDPVNDPHIIKYDKERLVLLDVVYNEPEYKKVPYHHLRFIGETYKLEVKQKYKDFGSWSEFYSWYLDAAENDVLIDGKHIEGFVFEDSAGFMFKMKLPYYNEWKFMRSLVNTVNKMGYFKRTSALLTPTQNYFYGFVKEMKEEDPEHLSNSSIIQLRDEFERFHN